MATIVASATGGNWSATTAWVGGVVPTSGDDVQVTGTSGNLTIDAGAVCRGVDFTGYTGTVTHTAGVTWTIGDATSALSNIAMNMVAGMTYTLGNVTTSTITFQSSSATIQTVKFAGKTTGNVNYNGTSTQLTGSHNTGSTATVTQGGTNTLDVNGQTCSWGLYVNTTSTTRTLTLGAASITMTGIGTAWNIGGIVTNFTITANTATITLTGNNVSFAGASKNWNGLSVVFTGTNTTGTQMSGSNTFANLTITGAATKVQQFLMSGNQTITGTFTSTGNSVINRNFMVSNTVGTTRSIIAATVSITNTDFMDFTGAGAASPFTGTSLGDCGGNSGVTFDTPATQTWSGTSGGNWSTNAWTSRVPLPQDNVVISAAFSASQTITADMPRVGTDVNFTGLSGSPTFNMGTNITMFGSLTLVSSLTGSIGGGFIITMGGRSTHTITSAGKTFNPGGMTFNAFGGTYTLQDALTLIGNLTINNGTFVTGNFSVSCSSMLFSNTSTRTLTLGTSTITLTTTAATTPISATTTTGLTFSGASATFVISNGTTNTRTFAGGSLTFGTLTYTIAGSTGTLIITGSNTFNTINFSDASNARTLQFTAGTTTTVTNWNVNGTAGKLMTINSTTAGTAATLSKSSGTVSSDYLSIQDTTPTGGASWYAGANSTSVSNTAGWIFTAPPAAGSSNLLLLGIS